MQSQQEIELSVKAFIEEVKPYVQQHGGDLEYIKCEDNIVYMQIKGACIGCPLSFYTFTMGIEKQLKERIPSIKKIEIVE